MEMQLTHRRTHSFKVHKSMVSGAFAELGNHHNRF